MNINFNLLHFCPSLCLFPAFENKEQAPLVWTISLFGDKWLCKRKKVLLAIWRQVSLKCTQAASVIIRPINDAVLSFFCLKLQLIWKSCSLPAVQKKLSTEFWLKNVFFCGSRWECMEFILFGFFVTLAKDMLIYGKLFEIFWIQIITKTCQRMLVKIWEVWYL